MSKPYLEKHTAEVFHLVTGEVESNHRDFFEDLGYEVAAYAGSLVLSGEEISYSVVMPDGYLSYWPSFGRLFGVPPQTPGADKLSLALSVAYDVRNRRYTGFRYRDEKKYRIFELVSGMKPGPLENTPDVAAITGLYQVIEGRRYV